MRRIHTLAADSRRRTDIRSGRGFALPVIAAAAKHIGITGREA